ncbi:RNA polymerase II degradation factor [Trema orientale]|uniref:RNA polymerase II degradation factor n=1 Tax=Trema orientale TaxID=63057 RepID=A0A2P5E6L0_TREOI|nr:RNA polymerase II degradation factor [Trema orientale]
MEATAAGRGGPMPIPSQQSRKEWRAVSDHHSVRNVGDEELERSKLGQSDERTIYERGREPLDVDFCSITIDGSLDNDLLQQRLHDVARQREELQQMETELRAQIIARSEMIEMQSSFDAQIKEHSSAATKLQEQLHERDQTIRELERKLEDKDRELHAIKLDNEAAWAKEGLLREQNKELASFRRERDHTEAERAQHIKKIHDLQEHIQEKERQLIDLQEQHRVAQENILYKDDRLREAQAWIARVQEMDALQQAELRERTEQYNQLWIACQRQFAEMERLHMHTIQQLQIELADARERSGTFTDETRISQENSKDVSQFGQNDGNQLEMSGGGTSSGSNVALPNGNSDNVTSYASTGNASSQVDHIAGVPIAPSSLLGMPSYLPPGQLTALHPYVVHQQGVAHSVPPHVPQSHVGHFHSVPAISSLQQWHNQQAVSEGAQISPQSEITSSQADQNLVRSDENYNYKMSVNGQALPPDYLDVHVGQGTDPESVISSSTGEQQVLESNERGYLVDSQPEQELRQISSHFQDVLRLESLQQNNDTKAKEQTVVTSMDGGLEDQVLTTEQSSSAANTSQADNSLHPVNFDKTAVNNSNDVVPEAYVSTGWTKSPTVGRTSEAVLLDERSLLACIVRTIPAGGRVRISSTLPNRLGKMLAPLHWHDYKKKYGKLDDFVASHPELFMVEGDSIQLREGAQKMVAANAAFAKVAAAAAASSPYSSSLPSVAVTPMAQNRQKKVLPLSSL